MKNEKTFIVLVEDNKIKADFVISSLEAEEMEYILLSAINPALKLITEEHERIDGIILDLGLPRFEGESVTNLVAGLDVLDELDRLEINIPTLINSSTTIEDLKEVYPFVFEEQRKSSFDVQVLSDFFKSL